MIDKQQVKLATIVPAAGISVRMGAGKNKAFIELRGYPIIVHTLIALSKCEFVKDVYVVVRPDEVDYLEDLLKKHCHLFPDLQYNCLGGGRERQQSVGNALRLLPADVTHVAVHDGARPFIAPEIFADCLKEAAKTGAAIVATPSKDTIKRVGDNQVAATLTREELRCVQTPQIFAANILRRAYAQGEKEGYTATDDAGLVERLGLPVYVVPGDYRNIKLTTPEDLLVAELYLPNPEPAIPDLRIGQGYDVHRLVPGRKLILGGVEIEHSLGLMGHSDADVLLHVIKDAILGACALGDIGDHFPDTDLRFKDVSSLYLLEQVAELVREKGYRIMNLDGLIIAQQPKIAPYKQAMRENIARVLALDVDKINIKATTTENLGFVGREEGIAASAVAMVIKILS